MTQEEIQENNDFWLPIITNEDGSLNKEQILLELRDFSFVMDQVSDVYCHITNSTLSKPNYYAADVKNVADDSYREIYRQEFKDFLIDMNAAGIITNRVQEQLSKEIEKYI